LQLEQTGEFTGEIGTRFGLGLGIGAVEKFLGRIKGIGGILYVLGIVEIIFLNKGIANIF
jgi:hypothetical protein